MTASSRLTYVVDDHDGTLLVIERMLQPQGIQTICFSSADDFLKGYGPFECSCHCMLLDIALPEMDGLSLQEEMQRRGIVLPIIFMTGLADVGVAVRALQHGAFDVIEKPLQTEVVLDRVTRALKEDAEWRRQWNRRKSVEIRMRSLSRRERDVLEQVLQGANHKVAADVLGITLKTFLKHRAHVLRKLEVQGEVELLLLMTEVGLAASSTHPEPREPVHHS